MTAIRSRRSWLASAVLGLAAGAACNSTTISGKGTGGTSGGRLEVPCATGCLTSDAVCGAVGCDDAGACVYPGATTPCPGVFCGDGTVGGMACDGMGACRPGGIGTVCPAHRGCTSDGGCRTSCNSAADCASGFACNAGACVSPIAAGSCTENHDCTSGICGLAGSGNCCSVACATGDSTCGATGCDDAGACVYPGQTVACGPGESCVQDTQTNASLCDGLGHCSAGTVPCTPFVCGLNACKTTCVSDADCATGAFCDVQAAGCCADLIDGGTLAVDSVLGDDAVACCGYGDAVPCRTLTRAMGIVGIGPTVDIVLQATVDGGPSGDWTPTEEVYPIELGWGVELRAPGIFFPGPDAGVFEIFDIAGDAGAASASIVGTQANPVGIGMGQKGNQVVDGQAIADRSGSTLYLANVSVNGNHATASSAIYASGTLVLGQDRSGAVIGPTQIGNDLNEGYTGIWCDGCTLSDVPMNGTSSVVIVGQSSYDLEVTASASVSLSSAPVFGFAPSSMGFNTCAPKQDGTAIFLSGAVTMSLDHAVIQCMQGFGIDVESGGTREGPTLTLNDTTIQNTSFALGAGGGSVVVSTSMIRYNGAGVAEDEDESGLGGRVDLSGGPLGGRNTVACSNSIEASGAFTQWTLGFSVYNGKYATMYASNVDWDTPGPDLFSCDLTLKNCTCQNAPCTDTPGADGMDAVITYGGTIVTTGNGLSPLDCAPPP